MRYRYSGYSRQARESKPVVVLQAYIDDSGLWSDPVSALGGWYASAETWIEFSQDWQAMLDKSPGIPFFKLRELRAGKGAFSGLNATERKSREFDAMAIIAKHRLIHFTCMVSQSMFEDAKKRFRPPILCSLYHVLAYGTMIQLVDYLYHKGIKDRVDFIFDEQIRQQRDIQDIWYLIKQYADPYHRRKLGATPVFEKDHKVLPIQAADLLIWFMRRQGIRHQEGKPLEPDPFHLPDGWIPFRTKSGFVSGLKDDLLLHCISAVSAMLDKHRRSVGKIKD